MGKKPKLAKGTEELIQMMQEQTNECKVHKQCIRIFRF